MRARVLMARKYHFLAKLIAEIYPFIANTCEFTAEDLSHVFTIIVRVKATILVFVEREK